MYRGNRVIIGITNSIVGIHVGGASGSVDSKPLLWQRVTCKYLFWNCGNFTEWDTACIFGLRVELSGG
jgi:hypothetical protein